MIRVQPKSWAELLWPLTKSGLRAFLLSKSFSTCSCQGSRSVLCVFLSFSPDKAEVHESSLSSCCISPAHMLHKSTVSKETQPHLSARKLSNMAALASSGPSLSAFKLLILTAISSWKQMTALAQILLVASTLLAVVLEMQLGRLPYHFVTFVLESS